MIEKEGNVDIKGEIWAHDDTEIDNYYSENVCIVKMVLLENVIMWQLQRNKR